MNLTVTFTDYFYSKCYHDRSATSFGAKGKATTCARLHSLDFGKRNRYLKGVAPIDAQQKNMELLTFSCSQGSSWIGMLPAEVWPPWLEDVSSNLRNWPT